LNPGDFQRQIFDSPHAAIIAARASFAKMISVHAYPRALLFRHHRFPGDFRLAQKEIHAALRPSEVARTFAECLGPAQSFAQHIYELILAKCRSSALRRDRYLAARRVASSPVRQVQHGPRPKDVRVLARRVQETQSLICIRSGSHDPRFRA